MNPFSIMTKQFLMLRSNWLKTLWFMLIFYLAITFVSFTGLQSNDFQEMIINFYNRFLNLYVLFPIVVISVVTAPSYSVLDIYAFGTREVLIFEQIIYQLYIQLLLWLSYLGGIITVYISKAPLFTTSEWHIIFKLVIGMFFMQLCISIYGLIIHAWIPSKILTFIALLLLLFIDFGIGESLKHSFIFQNFHLFTNQFIVKEYTTLIGISLFGISVLAYILLRKDYTS